MSTPEQKVVDQMFAAFNAKDLNAAMKTISEDSVWIQVLPHVLLMSS